MPDMAVSVSTDATPEVVEMLVASTITEFCLISTTLVISVRLV